MGLYLPSSLPSCHRRITGAGHTLLFQLITHSRKIHLNIQRRSGLCCSSVHSEELAFLNQLHFFYDSSNDLLTEAVVLLIPIVSGNSAIQQAAMSALLHRKHPKSVFVTFRCHFTSLQTITIQLINLPPMNPRLFILSPIRHSS